MHEIGAEESAWAQEITAKTRAFDHLLLSFIRGAIDSGQLRNDIPPRLVEHALFGMLNWTHRWFAPGGTMTGREIAEAFWSIFNDGMQPGERTDSAVAGQAATALRSASGG